MTSLTNDRPLSEVYKEAGDDWVEKDAIARLREETKSLRFAQRCQTLGDIPVNRAEQTIKGSTDWYEEVIQDVGARTAANKAKVYMESVKMRHSEHMNDEANHRAESRL
jgi:hypothetical protein